VAIETPIHQAAILSQRLGNQVLLKREHLQPVHSFKLRGAYNKMAGLSEAEAKHGVIAASGCNHDADYGQVLVATQVPRSEMKKFTECPKTIGYRYWDETDNVAYETFLAPA